MRQAAGQMRGVPQSSLCPGLGGTIDKHLRGGDGPRSAVAFVAGVYPMLPDETCWFLAADFDKESWAADAVAMIETCRRRAFPPRSNGPGPATAPMSGFSFRSRSQRAPLASWAPRS